MRNTPTDAAEVERFPRSAPSAAQPSSPARRGAGEDGPTVTGGPVQGWAGSLVITVIGRPAPQGSKRHVGRGVMVESSEKVKPWREAVKQAALDRTRDYLAYPFAGPVQVDVIFVFEPPKSAPKRRIWPTTRSSGDIDKLLRSTLDALTDAAIWRDDAQVVTVVAHKVHTTHPDTPLAIPGALIAVQEVTS